MEFLSNLQREWRQMKFCHLRYKYNFIFIQTRIFSSKSVNFSSNHENMGILDQGKYNLITNLAVFRQINKGCAHAVPYTGNRKMQPRGTVLAASMSGRKYDTVPWIRSTKPPSFCISQCCPFLCTLIPNTVTLHPSDCSPVYREYPPRLELCNE